jgi:hypothetical protein
MTLISSSNSSYDFVNSRDQDYLELLRLARVSEVNVNNVNTPIGIQVKPENNLTVVKELLNQLPVLENEHTRIMPLLNAKAKKLNVYDDLTVKAKNTLSLATQQGIVTELGKQAQLNKIITVLSAHTVPLILLKGAAFNGVLYSIQAPRTSNDLDILIKNEHRETAIKAIEEVMNYTKKSAPDVFGDLFEISFSPKNKSGAALDLHVSLTHPLLFNINEDQLWEESIQHPSYNNTLVRVLSSEHALIHQAIHAYKDMDFCKYNLIDSYELLNSQHFNIEKTVAIAKGWGASIPLFVLLKNCKEVMNNHIEISYINQIKPNFIMYQIIIKLLNSRFNQPKGKRKSLKYRINQVLAQFVFTGSALRPLALQWLFIKSSMKNKSNIR